MRFTRGMLYGAPLAAMVLALAACAKPVEKKAAEAPSATAEHTAAAAPAEGNRGTASAMFGDKTVSINYGRPQLQGRDMLAQAADGMVWRMGMNEATEIKTSADLKFGATVIPAGQYSLWMKKVSGDNWELVFNKKTGIWGHEHPASDDFASVPMQMTAMPATVETFTIEVPAQDATAGAIVAKWSKASLSAAFTVQAAGSM